MTTTSNDPDDDDAFDEQGRHIPVFARKNVRRLTESELRQIAAENTARYADAEPSE